MVCETRAEKKKTDTLAGYNYKNEPLMFWVKCVHQLLDPTCLHAHITEKPHALLSVPENWTKRFKHENRVYVQMQFALRN